MCIRDSASTLEYALYRLDHDYQYRDTHFPSLISHQPDLIIIESFAYNNYGNIQSGYDKQWQQLSTAVAKVKQSLPDTKILLAAAPAPNSVKFAQGTGIQYTSLEKLERTSTIRHYLQNIINYSQSQHYPLADAYHPSLIGEEGNPAYISTIDNLHLSPRGISFFTATITQSIYDNKLVE
jgi:hypothetical protein